MASSPKINNSIAYFDFLFKQNSPSYKEYTALISSMKKRYLSEFSKLELKRDDLLLKFSKDKLIELGHRHKALINEILREIIKLYLPLLNKKKVAIFWNGSFSINTNRLFSDYDLNFIYPLGLRGLMLPIEEQICSALAKIVGRPRDLVHGAMSCHLPMSGGLNPKKTFKKAIFRMKWVADNISLEEEISPGLENLMYRMYYTNRSRRAYEQFISSTVCPDRCEFWANTFENVIGGSILDKILSKVNKKEQGVIEKRNFVTDFNSLLIRLENKLFTQERELPNIDFTKVKNIKKYYNKKPLQSIFSLLALIHRRLLSKGFNIGPIKLNEYSTNKKISSLIGNNLSSEFFNGLYFYLWSILRLEAVFDKKHIRFGSHSEECVDESFQKLYSSLCPEVKNYIDYHNSTVKNLNKILLKVIGQLYLGTGKYDIKKEYINIDNYSPFSHINEVSQEYRANPFLLPFVIIDSEERPIHPDTFKDLNFKKEDIVKEILVYPTSSFRTVYYPKENICYKLPLLRRITRSIRDLSNKELNRSVRAEKLLSSFYFKGFDFLPEKCFLAKNSNFNYIIRKMPEKECFPWFYVIRSQKFNSAFEMKCVSQIIKAWMFLASKGIFLESPHTQNILVDKDANIYYRDLSDVRVIDAKEEEDKVLIPSFYGKNYNPGDVLSVIFDRAVCKQNLDHLFRYDHRLGEKERRKIKKLINSEIKKYNLPFPSYSMDFPKDRPERIPERTKIVSWRQL